MRQLPTGTLTLLFTDVEGSTLLLQQLGKKYAEMLRECRKLLRAAFQERHGYEVDTQRAMLFSKSLNEQRTQFWLLSPLNKL